VLWFQEIFCVAIFFLHYLAVLNNTICASFSDENCTWLFIVPNATTVRKLVTIKYFCTARKFCSCHNCVMSLVD